MLQFGRNVEEYSCQELELKHKKKKKMAQPILSQICISIFIHKNELNILI